MCINAARSSAKIVELTVQKGHLGMPLIFLVTFTSGITLVIGIWASKKNGLSVDVGSITADVWRCIEALHAMERIWHVAGKFWYVTPNLYMSCHFDLAEVHSDWLQELIFMVHPESAPAHSRKRTYDTLLDDDGGLGVADPYSIHSFFTRMTRANIPDLEAEAVNPAALLDTLLDTPEPSFLQTAIAVSDFTLGLPQNSDRAGIGSSRTAVSAPVTPGQQTSRSTLSHNMDGQSQDAFFAGLLNTLGAPRMMQPAPTNAPLDAISSEADECALFSLLLCEWLTFGASSLTWLWGT